MSSRVNDALRIGETVSVHGVRGVVSGSEGEVLGVSGCWVDVRLQTELVRVHQRYLRRVQPKAGDPADGPSE